jgi:hypothetical protein
MLIRARALVKAILAEATAVRFAAIRFLTIQIA